MKEIRTFEDLLVEEAKIEGVLANQEHLIKRFVTRFNFNNRQIMLLLNVNLELVEKVRKGIIGLAN